MQTVTTITGVKDRKTGTSARGPWTLTIFDAADGREYSTLKGDVASAAEALVGKLATVEYSERPAKDPKYPPSYSLEAVSAAPDGAKASPVQSAVLGAGKSEFRSPAQIIRSTALELAVDSYHAAQLDPLADQVGVISTAVVYEQFITEGIDEEPEA